MFAHNNLAIRSNGALRARFGRTFAEYFGRTAAEQVVIAVLFSLLCTCAAHHNCVLGHPDGVWKPQKVRGNITKYLAFGLSDDD